MSTELTGALIALIVPLCFGSGMVFARIGLVHLPANTGNFLSLVTGWLVIAGAAVILFPNELLGVSIGTLAWLAMIGLINFPVGRFLNFMSLSNLGVVRANPILSIAPIVSAFEGVVFLGEEINPAIGAGTLVAVAGMIVVVWGEAKARGTTPAQPSGGGGVETVRGRPQLVGYLAAGGAALAYGTVPVFGRVAVTELTLPLVTAVYTMLFGSLVMGAFVVRKLPRDLRAAPGRAIGLVAVGGVFMSTGVATLYLALSKAPVVVVSPVFALNPFVSMVLAHYFLQRLERITFPLVAGTALVVAGVVAVMLGTQL